MPVAEVIANILGPEVPIRVVAYDGSAAGPTEPVATLVVRSPDAIARVLARPAS